ncbi:MULTISPECIES: low molecular weight protein-tyrosine-phosphatase [Nitrincola]|uniref:protein-tyrosine-phosphatase n=1 Tax=Nitrincola nitratireducens TaxID=1229521 RepID=W9V4E4_9GAMM|nr:MULTISPECIES: low molecular weight protein-tyrosine-phosphatase [Nitrincola]EXJ10992.1 Low molecular weight protein-tyrosine-phosphatase yfkJ [Nitrincola nitratireducens]
MKKHTSVLFICLGNICRSPTAEGVFREMSEQDSHPFTIDSAGTAAWHIGKAPDTRSQTVALKRGYNLSGLRARQVRVEDFKQFDYLLAMDANNLKDLRALAPKDFKGHLSLFTDFAATPYQGVEVPDPYYTDGDAGFHEVVDIIEAASRGLLEHIARQQR